MANFDTLKITDCIDVLQKLIDYEYVSIPADYEFTINNLVKKINTQCLIIEALHDMDH